MTEYVGGRIVRLKVKNFMVYDDIEFHAKKGLNLIVGLNGSGKSTLMCAICLGLGGKPQHTGRATQISDFIKHGHQNAEIEIELESDIDETTVINRIINSGRSEWLINKESSSHAEVTTLVKKFNIDTGNLCQFLPQEKVVEFSKMDKKQRLENMLQAIGEPELFDLFGELKVLQQKKEQIEASIKKDEISKAKYQEKNDRISGEVMIQERRNNLRGEIEELNTIKTVMIYHEIRAEVLEKKNELRVVEEECKRKKTAHNDIVEQQQTQKSEYKNYETSLTDLSQRKKNYLDRAKGVAYELEDLHRKVDNLKVEYKHKLKDRANQEEKLKYYSIAINSLKAQYEKEAADAIGIPEKLRSLDEKLSMLQQQISQLHQEIEKGQTEKNKYMYCASDFKQQLAKMQDENNSKLQMLKKRDRQTYDAVIWLQENRSRFKSNIYLPIMLEIGVTNKNSLKYIENHISMRDFLAFVCEDKDDCKMLTEILCRQKNLPVNIVMDPKTPLSQFQSPIISRELRSCGLDCFLIDLFTAPDPVMRFLCSCYKVHITPVSTNSISSDKIDSIVKQFGLFYSGNMKVIGRKSRYGEGLWSIRKDYISDRNLLSNFDVTLQRALENKWNDAERCLEQENIKLEQLRVDLNEKESLQESFRSERKKLTDQLNIVKDLGIKIRQKESFRQTMPELINVEEEKLKLSANIMQVISEKQTKMKCLCEYLKDANSIQTEIVRQILLANAVSQKVRSLQNQIDEASQEYEEVKKKLDAMKADISSKTKRAKDLLPKIQQFKDAKILSEKLTNMTFEEVTNKIIQCQAELEINEDNEPIVLEFRDREKQIRLIEEKIDKTERDLAELKEDIDEKKNRWLEPLNKHVNGINKKFMHYFKLLNCAGEISLDTQNDTEDFNNYGLQIKLKFSATATFTELSHARNSGGECSVAAIIFILSLQELTDVPFRCIDEINQGMDSTNERKIYQLIADSVRNEKCSQYFLVTPKLLLGLQDLDNVTFHIIHNSRFLNSKINVKKVLDIVKSSKTL